MQNLSHYYCDKKCCACMRACMRACVHACVHSCVPVYKHTQKEDKFLNNLDAQFGRNIIYSFTVSSVIVIKVRITIIMNQN